MGEGKPHSGGCHCGGVRYVVTGDFSRVYACNCSMCQKKGTLLTFVPAAAFDLRSGENQLRDYPFNKGVVHHLFCSTLTCGVTSFARGVDRMGEEMVAVNVRCLDDVDLDALEISKIDGRSFEA